MTRNYSCCKRRAVQSLQEFRGERLSGELYWCLYGASSFWHSVDLELGLKNISWGKKVKYRSRADSYEVQGLLARAELRETPINHLSFSSNLPLGRFLFEVLRGKIVSPLIKEKNGFEVKSSGKNWKKKKRPLNFRRLADVLVAVIGLIVITLLIPLLWICNSMMNKGTLFYTQERVGKGGKAFCMYKFRTMRGVSEPNGPEWAQRNDHRVSGFGKFLRRSHLDELPQFYNILKGEMSLIGPRPERPVFVEELCRLSGLYMNRHVIRPGLTGWAQVMLPYGNSYPDSLEKLRFDLYYIRKGNLLLDLQILFKTVGVVLFLRGQ